MMLHTKYQGFRLCSFRQEDFIFSFWLPWEINFFTTLKGDYPRIIPLKFGEIQRSSLGGAQLHIT